MLRFAFSFAVLLVVASCARRARAPIAYPSDSPFLHVRVFRDDIVYLERPLYAGLEAAVPAEALANALRSMVAIEADGCRTPLSGLDGECVYRACCVAGVSDADLRDVSFRESDSASLMGRALSLALRVCAVDARGNARPRAMSLHARVSRPFTA